MGGTPVIFREVYLAAGTVGMCILAIAGSIWSLRP